MHIYWVYDFQLVQTYDGNYSKLIKLLKKEYIQHIQLRIKNIPENLSFNWIQKTIEIIRQNSHIPIYMNDDAQIAQKFQIDGVHIGKNDQNILEIKKSYPKLKIGYTCHDKNDILYAQKHHAHYIGFGTIFPSKTKKNLDAKGIEFLKKYIHLTHLPLYPIGGINRHNIEQFQGINIKCVALASNLFSKDYLLEAETINNYHA